MSSLFRLSRSLSLSLPLSLSMCGVHAAAAYVEYTSSRSHRLSQNSTHSAQHRYIHSHTRICNALFALTMCVSCVMMFSCCYCVRSANISSLTLSLRRALSAPLPRTQTLTHHTWHMPLDALPPVRVLWFSYASPWFYCVCSVHPVALTQTHVLVPCSAYHVCSHTYCLSLSHTHT